ncbi:uncharacterized protein BO88DRAFT_423081 [Aspergillus vadensis CBS 113365]|uniref:Uncharacterized protein n=1 Tax=Aspergillus vadensis (strain CBS 113365 / IMI 142717 / IBT 24658) TaxID=1448311 RepID=A0A319BHY1_ASPVC|nr:hypothetical protein BO88DRAFT_423081 [Aspergillus vadensis CBS 113365]PYH72247.1 hypothetical protein BO88DRAFT_423081 [Aspergillus vadensis CBS 113365]
MWIQTKLNWFPLSVTEQSGSSVTVAILVENQTIVRALIFLETVNPGSLQEPVSVLFSTGSGIFRGVLISSRAKPRPTELSAHAALRLTQIEEEFMMMYHQPMPDTVFRVPRDPTPCRFEVHPPREASFLPCGWRNRLLDMVQLSGELRPRVGDAQVCRAVT